MKSTYVKKYSEFVNEISTSAKYRIAQRYKELGHNKKAEEILDSIPKDETEFNVDLVAYEYYPLGDKDFPTHKSDAFGTSHYKGPVNHQNRKYYHGRKPKFIENARLVWSGENDGDFYMLFTDEEEENLYQVRIELTKVKVPEGEKVVFKGKTHTQETKLAYRKDIKILAEIAQQNYINSKFGTDMKHLIHFKMGIPENVDVYDLIPTMFEDFKRTFYSDENINVLKSEETIDKYDL